MPLLKNKKFIFVWCSHHTSLVLLGLNQVVIQARETIILSLLHGIQWVLCRSNCVSVTRCIHCLMMCEIDCSPFRMGNQESAVRQADRLPLLGGWNPDAVLSAGSWLSLTLLLVGSSVTSFILRIKVSELSSLGCSKMSWVCCWIIGLNKLTT